MENFLNYISANFFQITHEQIKIIVFVWTIIKCTLLFLICMYIAYIVSEKFFTQIAKRIDSQERQRQVLTLKALVFHSFQAVVSIIYLLNLLNLFGIDVRPILATAGVVGVAIGFGAKRSIEDIMTGLMILLEGQIRVGDYVEIHGMKGFVEKLSLNLVTLRSDTTGAVHFIRCGYIDTIVNYTMKYSYAFFPINVAYKEDVDKVFQAINDAYEILIENKTYKKLVLQKVDIYGLDEFKDSSLCIKCRIKTLPKGQWIIKRAFNKIIKEQFEKEHIEIPFNQLVVTNAEK